MKQILSDNKKRLMWRNAAIRKTFNLLMESKSSKMAAYEYLANKYKKLNGEPLNVTQIRIIIAKKKGQTNG